MDLAGSERVSKTAAGTAPYRSAVYLFFMSDNPVVSDARNQRLRVAKEVLLARNLLSWPCHTHCLCASRL